MLDPDSPGLESLSSKDADLRYKYIDPKTKTPHAVKLIYLDEDDDESSAASAALKKLSSLSHPNLLPLAKFADSASQVTLYYPYESAGGLNRVYPNVQSHHPPDGWTPATPVSILLGVARALEYLHSQKVGHFSLTPSSIVLSSKLEPLLTDYQLASLFVEFKNSSQIISEKLFFNAPELHKKAPKDLASDIFSFGVITYWMLVGPPYKTADRRSMAAWVKAIQSPPDLSTLPPHTQDFLRGCLSPKPADRPQIAAVLDFLTSHGHDMGFPGIDRSALNKSAAPAPDVGPLKSLADGGDPHALFFLGLSYEEAGDMTKAADLYKRSATRQSEYGQVRYGMYLQFTSNNVREAAKYYQLAANQGNADALNNWGGLMESGKLAGGFQGAFQKYEKAAEQNHPAGQYNLGRFYERGLVVTQDLAKALDLYRKASLAGYADAGPAFSRLSGLPAPAELARQADGGDARAQVTYGVFLYDQGNVAGAERYFKKAGDARDAAGLFNLAWLAKKRGLKGHSPVNLYRKAGERGLGAAWVNLAVLSLEADGDDEAWDSLAREAAAGDAHAWNNMGVAIARGFVRKDPAMLRGLYKRAADLGLAEAMQNLAALLETDVGGEVNEAQAVRYYRKAVKASGGSLKVSEQALKRLKK
jgi:TPR repeat protein